MFLVSSEDKTVIDAWITVHIDLRGKIMKYSLVLRFLRTGAFFQGLRSAQDARREQMGMSTAPTGATIKQVPSTVDEGSWMRRRRQSRWR